MLNDFLADGSVPLTGPVQQSNQSTPGNPPSGSNKLYFKSDNNLYILNSAGIETKLEAATGAGTVTSVGLALPASVFSISGSPVNTTGTLTGSFVSQTANQSFLSPNGSSGVPSFRSLVGADLPFPSSSTIGGVESIAQVSHEWINSISNLGVPSLSQPAFTDISGTLGVSQGGTGDTSFAVNAVILGGATSTGALQYVSGVHFLRGRPILFQRQSASIICLRILLFMEARTPLSHSLVRIITFQV
jgi:hypothetical protein